MDKYLKAVKQNICSICVDSTERGSCTLTNKEICAVELYLPRLIQVITSSFSDDKNEIQARLRNIICDGCRNECNGNCYLRNDANCSLDRYFPLIVETIQKGHEQVV